MIAAFLDGDDDAQRARSRPPCFGVAGPVIGESAELTNVPWHVDAPRGRRRLRHVARVPAAQRSAGDGATRCRCCAKAEVHVLQEGEALRGGNIALIAAGTGLGEALLHNVDGRFVPSPSEGGHADFAARTEREIALLRDLTARYGRADVEHVVSGRGLINIHRATHTHRVRGRRRSRRPRTRRRRSRRRRSNAVRRLRRDARHRSSRPTAPKSGNLALRSVSTGGAVHRRRHRAEDPAGAHAPASSCARSSQSRRSKRCFNGCR